MLGGTLWEVWGGALFLVPGHLYLFWGFVALIVPLLFSVALVGLCTTLRGWWRVLGGTGLALAGAGLFVAFCGSVWAQVLPMADVTPVCAYFAERGVTLYMLDWVFGLSTALVVIGVAVLGEKTLGRWSVAPLTGGLFGWACYVTDFGSTPGLFLAYIAFSLLFGLGWVVLGLRLWTGRGMLVGNTSRTR